MRLALEQKTFGFAVCACLLLVNSVLALNEPATANNDDAAIVLKNATIHTMGSQGTYVGSVIVSEGKITAIGPEVETPKDATVFDLKGCHLIPGLIESRGKLWLTPAAMTETNTKAELNVNDAIDAWSEDWRELASQGITSVYVQPNSTSSLGGYGSVLRVGPHGTPADILLKKEVAIQASIGTKGTTSKDRYLQVKALEKLFDSAKEKKSKDKKAAADKESKDDAKTEKDSDDDQPEESTNEDDDKKNKDEKDDKADSDDEKEVDPTKLALRRVLSREIPLFVEVHHTDSLKQVLELAKKFNIRVVFDGLSQTNGKTAELIESDYPIVVGPVFEASTVPAYRKNANFDWLESVGNSGHLWALSSFTNTPRGSRLLRVQAATAIALGADDESVLAAITSNAARMLGIADEVGSLEVGKQADIAVFVGNPLDPSVPTRLVMSNGKVTFDNEVEVDERKLTNTASAADDDENEKLNALPKRLPAAYSIRTTRLLQQGKFVSGTMKIDNGKIVSVDTSSDHADASDGPVYDLQNTVVTPGLVMASSSLSQSSAIGDSTESDTSHLRAVDAIDPTNKTADDALAGGFIHVGVSPGATNTSAGVAGHVRLGAADYVANPAIASQFVLSDSARRDDRFPSSLNGQVEMLGNLFGGQASASSVYVTIGIGRMIANEKMSNIKSVAEGSRVAIIAADSKLEIRSAISIAKKQNLRATLLSKGRVGEFSKALADLDFSLIVPTLRGDEYDAQLDQIIQANQAGVALAFAGDSPEKIRITAALLVNAGLASESALMALSEGGGQAVGMTNVGFSKDAPADFVVWTDSPLNLAAKPLAVVVDGQPVSKK